MTLNTMDQNVWFTSDQHYGHVNIIRYCDRPFSTVEEMNERFIQRHNEVVKPYEHVYMVGDVSFQKADKTIEILRRLNGIKHLIEGNHDRLDKAVRKEYASISELKELKFKLADKNIHITLCHYPMRTWPRSHYGAWNLHGHCHNTLPPFKNQLDIGVDSARVRLGSYRPFSLAEIYDIMNFGVN